MRKDSLRSNNGLNKFPPKQFEPEKRFRFFRFLRVGVCSRMLRPEMWLLLAVTSVNMSGFDILVKILWQFLGVLSASRHCIQLKLSQVTFVASFLIILPLNQNYVDKINLWPNFEALSTNIAPREHCATSWKLTSLNFSDPLCPPWQPFPFLYCKPIHPKTIKQYPPNN